MCSCPPTQFNLILLFSMLHRALHQWLPNPSRFFLDAAVVRPGELASSAAELHVVSLNLLSKQRWWEWRKGRGLEATPMEDGDGLEASKPQLWRTGRAWEAAAQSTMTRAQPGGKSGATRVAKTTVALSLSPPPAPLAQASTSIRGEMEVVVAIHLRVDRCELFLLPFYTCVDG